MPCFKSRPVAARNNLSTCNPSSAPLAIGPTSAIVFLRNVPPGKGYLHVARRPFPSDIDCVIDDCDTVSLPKLPGNLECCRPGIQHDRLALPDESSGQSPDRGFLVLEAVLLLDQRRFEGCSLISGSAAMGALQQPRSFHRLQVPSDTGLRRIQHSSRWETVTNWSFLKISRIFCRRYSENIA